MPSKKVHHFYSDLYKENIYLMAGFSVKQVQEYWDEFAVPRGVHGKCFELKSDKNDGVFIWLKTNKKTDAEFLVHECIHAASYILDSRGVEISAKNDEALAYLSQWIFSNCFKYLR